jgi:small-conductance mechanosensitive channel
LRSLAVLTVLLAASAALHFGRAGLAEHLGVQPPTWLGRFTGLLAWVLATAAGAHLLAGSVELWVRRSGRPPPALLLGLTRGFVWLVSMTMAVVVLFSAPIAGAITTSGVLVAVLGIAMRNLISDLFYGITMALERPFEIGEWVGLEDGTVGRVEEFTWRAIKLITRDHVKVVIPNSEVANARIANYDQPEPIWRSQIRIVLGHDLEPERAKRLLLGAVQQVEESRAIGRAAEAAIVGHEERGVEWELRFWVADYPSHSAVTQRIHEAVLHSLCVAGVPIPRAREEVWIGELERERAAERAASQDWIDRVSLFAALARDERAMLQARARTWSFDAGVEIVRQDDPGESLFALQEGVVEVWQQGGAGRRLLARLRPGDTFGEMSLLTGQPRTASVVAATAVRAHEVSKPDLGPLLADHPELAERLAEAMGRHLEADARRLRDAEATGAPAEPRAGLVGQLAERIRTFFKVSSR